MPYCPQCGSSNPDSARFCDQCGAMLIPVSEQPSAAPQPATGPTITAVPSASVGPSVCPQCGAASIPGEAFCDNCGAPLLAQPQAAGSQAAPGLPYSGAPPQPSYPAPQPVGAAPPQPVAPTPPQPVAPPTPPTPPATSVRMSLAPGKLIVNGNDLWLPDAAQAVVGRADAASSFFPDIDLTDHGALEHGVGRRHLRLIVQNDRIFAEDLDSTNGSFVNGQRLSPRMLQLLQSGDEIRLGNLAMRFQM